MHPNFNITPQCITIASLIMSGTMALSYILTPFIIQAATILKIVDSPDSRKVHSKPMPRMGGVGFVSTFYICMLILLLIYPDSLIFRGPILIGGFVIYVLGLIDDILNISPRWKFLVQSIVAGVLVAQGLQFSILTNVFNGSVIELDYSVSCFLSFIWIIGICNAINLIDGLDGLAAGVSLIALLTLTGISFMLNESNIWMISLPLAGALCGFLPWNFFPAKIFMGDCGSLFLGYMLAVLSIENANSNNNITPIGLLIPIVALGLPIFETIFSMIRRLLVGKKPFEPDKEHVHHRLMSQGFTHKQAVIILYGIMGIFCIIAMWMLLARNRALAGIFVLCPIVAYEIIVRLGYLPLIISYRHNLAKGVRRMIKNREFVSKSTIIKSKLFRNLNSNTCVQILIDYFTILLCWFGTNWIFGEIGLFDFKTIILLSLFWIPFSRFAHCYKYIWRYSEFKSLEGCIKAVTLTVLMSYIFSEYLGSHQINLQYAFVLWLLLNSTMVTTRMFTRYFYNYLKREIQTLKTGSKAIIFGAGDNGELILSNILKSDQLNFSVIGFIDDDPKKIGKKICCADVFGPSSKLLEIHNSCHFDFIIVSSPPVLERTRNHILEFSTSNNVRIVTVDIKLSAATIESDVYHYSNSLALTS